MPVSTTSIPASARRVSNSGGNFSVPVADEVPGPASGVVQVHDEVAPGLGHLGGGRVGGGAEDPDAAAGVCDDGEDVQPGPSQCDCLQDVAGQQCLGLGVQEVGRRAAGAVGCGVDAGGVEDFPRRWRRRPACRGRVVRRALAGCPWDGFSRTSRSTRARMDRAVRGRPGRLGREAAACRRERGLWCQRRTVCRGGSVAAVRAALFGEAGAGALPARLGQPARIGACPVPTGVAGR